MKFGSTVLQGEEDQQSDNDVVRPGSVLPDAAPAPVRTALAASEATRTSAPRSIVVPAVQAVQAVGERESGLVADGRAVATEDGIVVAAAVMARSGLYSPRHQTWRYVATGTTELPHVVLAGDGEHGMVFDGDGRAIALDLREIRAALAPGSVRRDRGVRTRSANRAPRRRRRGTLPAW